MSRRKPSNLSLSLPRCGNCGRHWQPASGIVSDSAFCRTRARERRTRATSALGLKSITSADLAGGYLLPRELRQH
jgi:hypothetical protein